MTSFSSRHEGCVEPFLPAEAGARLQKIKQLGGVQIPDHSIVRYAYVRRVWPAQVVVFTLAADRQRPWTVMISGVPDPSWQVDDRARLLRAKFKARDSSKSLFIVVFVRFHWQGSVRRRLQCQGANLCWLRDGRATGRGL